jgi:L,D-transpeptidase ErfK/SrfK
LKSRTISPGCVAALAVAMIVSISTRATTEPPPNAGGNLVGRHFSCVVRPGDTLRSLPSRYGIAVWVLANANYPEPQSILYDGEVQQIDNRHVVPQMLTNSILINLPQRLLFVFEAMRLITCYPVALERSDWPTLHRRFHDRSNAA